MKNTETQQTAVKQFANNLLKYKQSSSINGIDYILIQVNEIEQLEQQAKEMEKNQHRSTADIFESEGFERCYYHSNHDSLNFEKWYNETYGGNK